MMKPSKPHIFIAGPYSAETAYHVHTNVNEAEKLALEIAKLGAVPVCPHTMYRNFDGTLTHETWLEITQSLRARCDAVVLTDGWGDSPGAQKEFAAAREEKQPIFGGMLGLRVWLKGGGDGVDRKYVIDE